jgi:hypothetical protein
MPVLYEDKYAILTDQELILKLYYFPFGKKTIKYNEIVSYWTAARLGLNLTETKVWGMGLSPIWWACGPLHRGFELENQIVVKVRDASIQCGFTSLDVRSVLQILRDKAMDLPGVVTHYGTLL